MNKDLSEIKLCAICEKLHHPVDDSEQQICSNCYTGFTGFRGVFGYIEVS